MTNIALVVLDTLRKDAFDRHFGWLPGRRYERAYSTANWTVPAHASLFTGRYASEVGTHAKNLYFDGGTPALAERLRDVGYTTRAFSANTNITGHFEFDRGFTDFRGPDQFDDADGSLFNWREFSRMTSATGWRRYVRAVYECIASDVDTIPSLVAGAKLQLRGGAGVEYGGAVEALSELDDMAFGDDEFLFLNLMEAHEPYRVPDEYETVEDPGLTESIGDLNLEEGDVKQFQAAYDDSVRYLSDVYRDVFAELEREFDYVITLSDHGELLGEHGGLGHEHGVYPSLTHVPLCISGERLDGTCETPVNLLDVYRTVCALADVPPGEDARGRDLLSDDPGHDCLTEFHGLTAWSKRSMAEHGHGDQIDRYDRELCGYAAEGYYAYETLDGFEMAGERPPDEDPRDRLDRLVAELDVERVEENTDVPEEIQDRLEDLGYA